MDLGAFSSGLLTGLREGVEAALILAIICAYLARTGNRRHFAKVFLGAGIAVVPQRRSSAIAIYVTVGSFQEPYEQLFEAATLLLAAAVVTWMLFWMRRQAAERQGRAAGRGGPRPRRRICDRARLPRLRRGHPRGRRDIALPGRPGGRRVEREGGAIWVRHRCAIVGLCIAAVLGVGFYHGSRRAEPRDASSAGRASPSCSSPAASWPSRPRTHRDRRHHRRDARPSST